MRRILFLGQKWVGEQCFARLLQWPSRSIAAVGAVTNPRTNVWWGTNKIWKVCQEKGLPFLANTEKNEIGLCRMIRETKANTLVSVQHPYILSKAVLDEVNGEAYNLHCAKLPEYGGHNACNHVILNKDPNHYCTIHQMDVVVDRGGIVCEESFPVAPDDTAWDLYEKGIRFGGVLFERFLQLLSSGEKLQTSPTVGKATFYPRQSIDELRRISNVGNTEEVELKARAFYFPPFEPAFFLIGEKRYYVVPPRFAQNPKSGS